MILVDRVHTSLSCGNTPTRPPRTSRLRRKTTLAAAVLALLGMCSVANAGAYVWFEATPLTPCAYVVQQGALGVSTALQCGPEGGPECLFQINIWFYIDGVNEACLVYDIALQETGGPPCYGEFSDLVHNIYPGFVNNRTLLQPQYLNIISSGSGAMIPVGTAWNAGSFILHKPCLDIGVNEIHAGTANDGFGWMFEDWTSGMIYWGGNTPIAGDLGNWAPLPVITTTCLYEPPGACCFSNGTCTILPETECLAQNGVFLGEGTTCSGLDCNNNGVDDTCDIAAGTSQDCQPNGIPDECDWGYEDCWKTTCGDTRYSFDATPLPPGFFGDGSWAFNGTVWVGGAGGGPFDTDTTVRRQRPFCFPLPPPVEDEVPIELVRLNLASCEPIIVYYDDRGTELWDVSVGLSVIPPQVGLMTATMSSLGGGTFSSSFWVQPRFTFTKVSDPGQQVVFDTGVEGIAPMLMIADDVPWLVNPPHPTCSPFAPGLQEGPGGQPSCVETCHENYSNPSGHLHCTRPPCCLLGDMNGDCALNNKDDQCFVNCALDYPAGCNCAAGDFNGNGSVGTEDITPFISALLSSNP